MANPSRHSDNFDTCDPDESLPKVFGWVARNMDGTIYWFEVQPIRLEDKWWDRDYRCVPLDDDSFPDISWDDEPTECKLIAKLL